VVVRGELKQVRSVLPLDDYKLLLEFSNNEKRVFDMKPLLDKPVFKPLWNKELFQKAHIVFDYTVAWNDDLDVCPDSLYRESMPVVSGQVK